ncbi:Flp pilus assembly complex ATPase component TadA [Candidatus Peribacteria bacterium]|nr:Flp pilus assembly complex ATPase component TadA [Candidatus Peribacteria bacterium]
MINKAIDQPNGIILNSGPTGSGKSTTLYAIMKKLNQPKVNIMTFEDPVEIVVDGLNQSQVFPDI